MAVVIETTIGDITIDLFVQQRPRTCKNFLKLCKVKYYNFCLFHSVQANFLAQTGDPTGSGTGGQSVYGLVHGSDLRYYEAEKIPKIKHDKPGLLSMVNCGDNMVGSQFFVTLGSDLQSLEEHCVFAEVTEGHDVLIKLNDAICDFQHRPYQDIRITHTVVLEDPFEDPPGLMVPDMSPDISMLPSSEGRIAADEKINDEEGLTAQELEEMKADREAKARATILEIVGDIPDSEIAPPENVLFVCKLNPVTTDEDLEIIFCRFGKIKSCEVIRDRETGDSLQYAFIEFEDKKACEQAFLKMDNVLIDDRRIHVDFSQSVAKMRWRGKGRGVEYFDKPDDRDPSRDRRYSSSRGDSHRGGRDRDRDRRRDDDRRRRDRESEDARRRDRRKDDSRRRDDDSWRDEDRRSTWEDDRKRRERDDRRREEDRRHNGRRDTRRRDDDRRRDDRRRNGSDRRDKERDSRHPGTHEREERKAPEKEEVRNDQKGEKSICRKEEVENSYNYQERAKRDSLPKADSKNSDTVEDNHSERKRTPKMDHKKKRSPSPSPRKKRSRRDDTSSSDSSSSDSSDSSSSSTSVDKRKRPKPSVTVAKKYYQGGKLVKVVKKRKGHSSDSDSYSDESSDSDRRRKKRKYKRKVLKLVVKKKRKQSSDSESDSSSSDDSDSEKYKKRKQKNSKSKKKKRSSNKKSKRKSDSSESSEAGTEKSKSTHEKCNSSDSKCKVR